MSEFYLIEEVKESLFNAVESDQISVEHFPDNPENYALANPNGAILVSSGESNYQNTGNNEVQAQLMEIKIYILSAKLVLDNGIYAITDKVLKKMDSYPLQNKKPYKLKVGEPQYIENQFWVREVIYLLPKVSVRGE